VVFLGSRPNAELVPKFHVTPLVSRAALPMSDQNFSTVQSFQRNIKNEFLSYALPLPEGRAGTAWEPSKPEI
jgi:hypothetical protein